jgi:hypothetical protein
MKVRITDPESIRKRERALFEAISETLDREALSRVFRAGHRLERVTDLVSRQGDFIVRDGAVAYRLDFDVRAVLSVVFDRSGNYLASEAELANLSQAPDAADGGFSPEEGDLWPESSPGLEPDPFEGRETVGLDELVRGRSDMIQDPPGVSEPPAGPPPREKMSRMANELAGMISDINGKKGQ